MDQRDQDRTDRFMWMQWGQGSLPSPQTPLALPWRLIKQPAHTPGQTCFSQALWQGFADSNVMAETLSLPTVRGDLQGARTHSTKSMKLPLGPSLDSCVLAAVFRPESRKVREAVVQVRS